MAGFDGAGQRPRRRPYVAIVGSSHVRYLRDYLGNANRARDRYGMFDLDAEYVCRFSSGGGVLEVTGLGGQLRHRRWHYAPNVVVVIAGSNDCDDWHSHHLADALRGLARNLV